MLKIRKADVLLIGAAAIVAAGTLLATQSAPANGTRAVVTVSGSEPVVYALAEDRTVTVTGKGGRRVTVEILGGKARVKESECPDLLCVRTGWLSQSGQAAVCVPAGVSVHIEGGHAEVDGVTA